MDTIKKISNIALKVITWLLVAFTVFMTVFTIVTVTTVDKNERSIFGVKFYIVKTDSMSKSDKNADLDVHFDAGDIILIKNIDNSEKLTLKAGDIIAFMSTNTESYGETVTHMIREVKTNSEGRFIGYVTYGTNTGVNGEAVVEPEYILGKYSG
jgi:signal peptidase I